LGATSLVGIGRCTIVDLALAWEVRAIGFERGIAWAAVRLGVGHEHVSTGKGSQAGNSESLREHFE
jgi:hypothetical protein